MKALGHPKSARLNEVPRQVAPKPHPIISSWGAFQRNSESGRQTVDKKKGTERVLTAP